MTYHSGDNGDICKVTLGKGKAVPLQAWSGPEGSFIVKVKQSRYRPGVAQRVPL
jgi:hypothetical protein